MNIVLLIFVVVIAALDVKATLVLVRSSCYDARQKSFQLALIWLLPVVGAVLVWTLATESPSERATTDLRERCSNDDGQIRHDHSSFEGGSGDAGGGD